MSFFASIDASRLFKLVFGNVNASHSILLLFLFVAAQTRLSSARFISSWRWEEDQRTIQVRSRTRQKITRQWSLLRLVRI